MADLSPERAVEDGPRRAEERRRFARLRALLADEGRRRRLVLIGASAALLLVALLAVLARLYIVLPVDVWFTGELQRHQWSLVARAMYAVSIFGYMPWSLATVAAGTALAGALLGWRDGLYLLLVTAGQGIVNALIKRSIGRPRPIDTLVEVFVPEHGFSFPSGHVMFYTVFFGLLLYLALARAPTRRLRWLLGAPLAALVALVGPSRIILGSHWLSDVIAAYLLGLVLLVLAIEGYHRLPPAGGATPPPPSAR